jgi:hypothetical protein
MLFSLCVLITMVVGAEIEAHNKQKKIIQFFCRIP